MGRLVERVVSLDVVGLVEGVLTVALAFLVAIPVAWDRERATRTAGLRTFPLISAASAAYVIIAREALADAGDSGDVLRVVHGLMTGLGFLGAGAIIESRGQRVRGMATAVALWSTAAIGAAVAFGRLEIALVLLVADLIGLRLLWPVKDAVPKDEVSEDEPRRGAPEPLP